MPPGNSNTLPKTPTRTANTPPSMPRSTPRRPTGTWRSITSVWRRWASPGSRWTPSTGKQSNGTPLSGAPLTNCVQEGSVSYRLTLTADGRVAERAGAQNETVQDSTRNVGPEDAANGGDRP